MQRGLKRPCTYKYNYRSSTGPSWRKNKFHVCNLFDAPYTMQLLFVHSAQFETVILLIPCTVGIIPGDFYRLHTGSSLFRAYREQYPQLHRSSARTVYPEPLTLN